VKTVKKEPKKGETKAKKKESGVKSVLLIVVSDKRGAE
jgi:hypothetical protein